MQGPLPPPPVITIRLTRRLLAALAVAIVTAGYTALMLHQPATGSVSGVCRDSKTGEPLSGVDVTLTGSAIGGPSDGDDSNDSSSYPQTPTASDDPLGRTQAPSGWAEDSLSDNDFDMAGWRTDYTFTRTAETDDDGHFSFSNLPVGEYSVEGSSTGHQYTQQNVVVLDAKVNHVSFDMAADAGSESLSFDSAAPAWLPTEVPVLGLQGVTGEDTVTMTLERIDLGDALANYPGSLASTDQSAKHPGQTADGDWGGKCTIVRTWVHTIGSRDDEGSFYDHIAISDTPLAAGFYWIKAVGKDVDGATIVATYQFHVTDIALVTKSTATRTVCYVADLATGRPRAGIALSLFQNDANPPLSSAVTNLKGLATVDTSKAAKESHGTLIARTGDATAVVSLSLNSPGDSSDGDDNDSGADADSTGTDSSLRSLIYTDRPIYRPGNLVHIKGIMRLLDPAKGYIVPAGKSVDIDITDPVDDKVSHATVQTNAMGSWTYNLTLNTEALSGEYSVTASLEGQDDQGTFRVASYHKPEYKVTVTFDKPHYIHGDIVRATVTATYYYGAPLAGAKAHISVSSSDSAARGDSGSERDDNATPDSGSGDLAVDEDVLLDPQGRATVEFPTKSQPNVEGGVDYDVDADVHDPSGASIFTVGTVTVSQGNFALALGVSSAVAHVGETVIVTATATNADGKSRANQPVTVVPKYGEWTNGKYIETKLPALAARTDSGGIARMPFVIPQNGEIEFDAAGNDDVGNTVTASTELWAPSNQFDVPGRYSDLQLILDKKQYAPGEVVHALVNTDHPGASALVTVEGRDLYQAFIIPMVRNATQVDVKLTQQFAPGVTLSVCTIVDKQFLTSSSDVVIADPRRPLRIKITPEQAVYHPGDTAAIDFKTTDQFGVPVPAEISAGVVDSAVYAIQEDETPDIVDAFEPEQGDAVKTGDSCERVYYGDVDKGAVDIHIRKKFVDTALWAPDIMTGKNGKARRTFTVPDNLTTWRVTCFGHTLDTRVGTARATFEVNKPLLVRIEAPAFLTAGDEATVAGLVDNNTAGPIHAHVAFSASGVHVLDPAGSAIDVAPNSPARLTWRVRADRACAASLTLTAAGGGLSDGAQLPLPVDPHGITVSSWQSGSVTSAVNDRIVIDPKAIAASSSVRVHLSPSTASAMLPAVRYLTAYPYGSADSTASVLAADSIVANAGALNGAGPAAIPLTAGRRRVLREMVDRSLLRLRRMQTSDGEWGWFPGRDGDCWDSSYVAWSLLLARDAGFLVDPVVLKAAVDATAKYSSGERKERYPDTYVIAFSAMVLARAGDRVPAENNLRFMRKYWNKGTDKPNPVLIIDLPRRPESLVYGPWSSSKLPPQNSEVAMCALAYFAQDGARSPDAHALMSYLWTSLRKTGVENSWTEYHHTTAQNAAFELSDVQATAWGMMAAEKIAPHDPRIDLVARWLLENRNGDHWCDPCDTTLVLYALTNHLAATHELSPNYTAIVTLNGAPLRTIHVTAASLVMPDIVLTIPVSKLGSGINSLRLVKSGVGRLYYSVETRQCLMQLGPPPQPSLLTRVWRAFVTGHPPLPPAASGYRVKRSYLRMTTRRNWFWEDTVPAPETAFNTREVILGRLIIDATRPGARLVVTEPIPAGCTVTDLTYDQTNSWDNWWDFTDIRDNKVTFFISNITTGRHEIDYHLMTTTPGAFDVLPASITSTVDPTLHAIGESSHITVDQGPL